MSSPKNTNVNATSPSQAASTPRLTNSPPPAPVENRSWDQVNAGDNNVIETDGVSYKRDAFECLVPASGMEVVAPTKCPPLDPAPNAPLISSSDDANSIDLGSAKDPNINHDNNNIAASSSGIGGVEQMNAEAPEPPVSMTAAAAIIVAKQRRGAPGVEHDGVHDAAPTPYDSREFEDGAIRKKMAASGVTDSRIFEEEKEEEKEEEEEEGVSDKKMPALSRKIDSNQEIEDDQEQEYNYNRNDVEVNAGRPLHQAVTLPTRSPPRSMLPNANDEESIPIEAMLVPNEPVYELQPVPAWYRQKKARPFFAFACFMFIAAVVVISVLLASSSPDESSPNTTVVTFVSLASFAPSISFVPSTPPSLSPSMTQSTQPSTLPSIVPSTTSHPSTLPSSSFSPSSSPTNKCFDNKEQLRDAINLYTSQSGCLHDGTYCDIGRTYGYPMNSWCVGQITDMSEIFRNDETFDQDISGWDVSSVTDMFFMFGSAQAFSSDLSGWNTSSVTNMVYMFDSTSAFNSDLSRWDTSSVTDMSNMFWHASAFNIDLSGWNISSVESMSFMFFHASEFNQDLCAWSDKFPFSRGFYQHMFAGSGCTFQSSPNDQQVGPFCASTCPVRPSSMPSSSQEPSATSLPSQSPSISNLPSLSSGPSFICYEIDIALVHDWCAEETSWELRRGIFFGNGVVLASYAGTPGDTSHTETLCLKEGLYIFTIYDSAGDGISRTEKGQYNITSSNGELIAEGREFELRETTIFSIPFVATD
mmetsp:Transcript_23315/g.44211  ORF Transcript_23315/g.44211 Transcript_23315/m.44211 type:complete len:757 (+) Transcript_23315:67-2337(+)